MSKKSKKEPRTQYEVFRAVRGTWNGVNPVTKVIPDKRRKAPKHKGKEIDE